MINEEVTSNSHTPSITNPSTKDSLDLSSEQFSRLRNFFEILITADKKERIYEDQ
jgi:hypothetical protein